MDRIVWLIVLTVLGNLALEITGVTAQTKDSQSYGPPQARNSYNDVELVDPMEKSSSGVKPHRVTLFDNIFKVRFILLLLFVELQWFCHVREWIVVRMSERDLIVMKLL